MLRLRNFIYDKEAMEIYIYFFWSIQQISLKYHFSPSVVFCIDNRVMGKSYKTSSELQQL